MRVVKIVNQSRSLADTDAAAVIAAVQKQVSGEFADAWKIDATLRFDGSGAGVAPHRDDEEAIFLLDNSDQANALGYHTENVARAPRGYVFVEASGDQWPITFSHEVLEQLADPWVSALMFTWLGRIPLAIATECADPVESDAYPIDGVLVSNFVYPAWFDASAPPSAQLDQMQRLNAPLTLTPGGYALYMTDLRNWKQATGRLCRSKQPAQYGRRHRRGASPCPFLCREIR